MERKREREREDKGREERNQRLIGRTCRCVEKDLKKSERLGGREKREKERRRVRRRKRENK